MKFVLALLCGMVVGASAARARAVISLDGNWRWIRGDAPGAEQPVYDDSKWQTVQVPNDWSIAAPFAETNLAGGAGAFLPTGAAWYRKRFSLPDTALGKRVWVEFDGVMANSDVWVNGMHLGHHPNGYTGFRYEVPGALLAYGQGTLNTITVCADTSKQPASRWYAGSGIYRHARVIVTDPVHLAAAGVFVYATNCTVAEAEVQIETAVTNEYSEDNPVSVETTLYTPAGEAAGFVESSQTIEAGTIARLQQQINVSRPERWSPESPRLYRAVTKLHVRGRVTEEQTTVFGLRDARFEDSGFWLNGRNLKLKGVCLHADGGAFGAAVPLAIWEARLKTLKALGVNAVRTAHNPPAPEFLDLCDRLGLLVMDEFFDCWTVAKNPYDYHLDFADWSAADEREIIERDRNHPSVIIYSVGNEIRDTRDAEPAKIILSNLVTTAHMEDPTRPVTMALFRPNASHDYENGLADLLDVVGQNYREDELLAAHAQNLARKILGTENTPGRRAWLAVRDHAPLAGEFLWTGIDYLGEARAWPAIGAGYGLLDRTGAVRPVGREIESWWSDKPIVALARAGGQDDETETWRADWTPETVTPHTETVEVFSNCKEVELFLNGKSLGKKALPDDAAPREWTVPFSPGTLRSVGLDERGRVLATNELRTAGRPARIRLQSDTQWPSAKPENVTTVRATVMDAQGVPVPSATNLVTFKVSGAGSILAVDNGDDASHEPFQATARHAYGGECAAFVRATRANAAITVTASAPGLKSGSLTLWATAPAAP